MQSINVQRGQTLVDIAIEHTGHLDTLFDIALLNGGISITAGLQSGAAMQVNDGQDEINKKNLDYYKKKEVHPATGDNQAPGGIGYWAIGIDLIVA